MSDTHDLIDSEELDRLADESGLAIAIVDARGREISVSNNNSICRNLNPPGEFVDECAAFCGTAFDEATEIGTTVSFTCHAGLECRAVPLRQAEQPLVAIVGRTFVKAENYRKATERAIEGSWNQYPPSEFFENILLTGTPDVLDRAAERVKSLLPFVPKEAAPRVTPKEAAPPVVPKETVPPPPDEPIAKPVDRPPGKVPEKITNLVKRFNREMGLEPRTAIPETPSEPAVPIPETPSEPTGAIQETPSEPEPAADPRLPERRMEEIRAWRSFFSSLLKTDYLKAASSILEFLAHQYHFSALIWLDKKDARLESLVTHGEMKNRKVRLGIAVDDGRLIEASQNEMPLQLGERSKDPLATAARTMNLFPIGVGGEISAAIAILDEIESDSIKKQIARICHSIAPQLEILRLRSEVERGDTLSTAVRRFSESLKHVDGDDLWLNLTQNAAEMLRAERASLLIFDEKAAVLEIKAMVGAEHTRDFRGEVGGRVSKVVFAKNLPVAIADVSRTGLPPAPPERRYKTTSFLSCPISISGRTIGVMNFADRACGEAFDKRSLELFQAIAPQLAVAIDRASLKEKAGEFEQLSVTDALTGLLNRRYIEARLMEEIKRSNRHGFPMSFMMLDVDHFKSYNDKFGHPAGDVALKLIAYVIRETLRGADVAARFGGEEFSILLPQTTAEEAAAIAERIRSNIENTEFPHRRVTASIGVASCSAELCVAADLISAADKALYAAKRRGRNRVLTFEEMNGATSE